MCVIETYRRVRVGTLLSDMLRIENGLKQGDALSSLLYNFAIQYAIRRADANQKGFKLDGRHLLYLLLIVLIYWAQAFRL